MKTKLTLLLLFFALSPVPSALSQVPQGFNYQAIARDGAGTILPNTPLQVMFYVQSLSTGGTIYWKELHASVTTNSFGLFSLVIGTGVRQVASTVVTFDLIDWSVTPKYLFTQIYYSGSWKDMGTTQLYTVPYAMTARNLTGTGKLGITGTTTNLEEAIFEVKNKDGQTVLAVYNEGVRIYVDDGNKGTKGGFAVGGFGTDKALSQRFLYINADSTRVYVDEAVKGTKGGFAVGGFDASKGLMTGSYMNMTPDNYLIGAGSGKALNGGLYNSFFGYRTGLATVTGSNNVFLGYQVGEQNLASNNVFIGYQAGLVNTSGYNNIFIGYKSGVANTEADNNVFIGSETGFKTTLGARNVFVGYLTGHENVTGTGNSYMGFMAGYSSLGSQNSFFGYNAGYYNTTGSYNVYMGPYAGRGSVSGATGSYNVFLGNYSGQAVTTGSYNSFVGFMSGRNFTSGVNNSYFGYEAGYNSATGNNNTFIGYQAGRSTTSSTAFDNVMIGQQVGYLLTTGHDNIALGNQAGYNNTAGNYNIYIGSDAGKSNQTSNYNTMIGYLAGTNSTQGYNTMIGYHAGYSNTAFYNQVFIGYKAGFSANGGHNNTYVGSESGYSNSAGAENVFVGIGTGRSNQGSNNVFLGAFAGDNLAGSNKLVIENTFGQGDNAVTPLIYGEFDNNRLRFNANTAINMAPSSNYALQIGLDGDDNYGLVVWGSSWGSSAWIVSDIRLKTNIKPLQNALSKVLLLNGVTFNFKTETYPDLGLSKSEQIGFVAQEVEKVLPQTVSDGPGGFKSVEYTNIVPVLVEAIKEQQKQIDELKAEIEQLKNK
jgi:hypothetical protein